MQSGSQHSQGGAYSHFQRGSNGCIHSPQDGNVTLANGLPQNMVTIQYPPRLGVAHGPAQRQQGNTQALQNFQGHQHPLQSRVTAPSSSERTNANIELLLHKRQSQPLRSWPAALNFGQTPTPPPTPPIQGLDNFGGILYTSLPPQFSSSSQSSPPSTDRVLPVGRMLPPSDEEILNYIAKRLEYYRTILDQEKSHTASAFHQAERFSPDVITECTAANGQVPEETSSKASQTYAGTGATSASEKCSAENLQIILTTATTCVKNEDEGPVVLSVVPGMTLDDMAEKHSSLTFNCSTSQEVKPPLLNISTKDIDQIPGCSQVIKHTNSVKGGTDLRPVEALVSDNVQGVRDISKNFQNGSCSVVSENRTFGLPSHIEQQVTEEKKIPNTKCQKDCVVASSEVLLPSNGIIQIHKESIIPVNQSKRLSNQLSCDGAREDVSSVSPKTYLPINKEPASLLESNGEVTFAPTFLKVPQYEDISDDDASQLGKNEELVLPACFEERHYDDISECEDSETDGTDLEKPPTQIPELNNEAAPSENEGSGNVQVQTQTNREIISSEEFDLKLVLPRTETLEMTQHGPSSLCFTETDDGFKDLVHPKRDSERHLGLQTNPTPSCSRASVLADEDEADDLMDEEDWFVLPVSISDLKFEVEDENHSRSGEVVPDDAETEDEENLCETNSMQLEEDKEIKELPVFDTISSYLRSQMEGKVSVVSYCNLPEQQMVSEDKLYAWNESYPVSEDSSGTEDSADYSSGPEHNHLTVSRKLVLRPSEVNDSASEEDNEVANVRDCQTASSECTEKHLTLKTNDGHLKHVRKTSRQKISEDNDVIILDSDTDDESDHKWEKKRKRKKFLSSSSGGSGNDMCSGHSPATADSRVKFPKKGLPSSDSTEPQSQSKPFDRRHEEAMQDARSDGTEKREASGFSPQKESIIILDSDTDDDSDQRCQKAERKRLLSSGAEDGGDAPHLRKRQSPESADTEYRTTKEKLKETNLCSAATSLPQKQPKPEDTQFKKVTQGSQSDQWQDGKKQAGEAKGGSSHVQHKTERQVTSKEGLVFRDSVKELKNHNFSKHQANRQSKLSSEGKCNGFPAPKTRPSNKAVDRETAKEKPKKLKLSPEHSTKRQPRSKSKEDGSHVIPDPVVAQLSVCTDVGNKSQDMKTPSTKNKTQAIFRPFSLPSQSSPSSSISSSSSTSRPFSEAKQRPVTSCPPKPQQSTSIPRKPLPGSELQRSHSNSSTSASDHTSTLTKGPTSAIMITARRQEIRRRRRRSLGSEDSRARNFDSVREARPHLFDDSAPRRRQSSHKPVPPLMKKTTKSAIELTKARSRDVPKEQSYPVGEGYKWSEKSAVSKSAKGPSWESELEWETSSTHRFRPYW